MKKYAFLALIFISALTSCSIDDGTDDSFSLEVIAIDSVDVPEYFVQGETYEMFVTYTRPNSCYFFNDFIYEIEGHERTVAVVNTVYGNNPAACNGESEQVTVNFNFSVNSDQTYVFKFYQGEGEDGQDQYHLVEIPVTDERPISENVVKD